MTALARRARNRYAVRMTPRIPLHLLLLLTPLALSAANQEQEYQQVRTIALRDPKVRAAYEDADRRLEEKILKIDPALESYVKHRGSNGGFHATSESAPAPTAKPKPAPASKPAPSKPAAPQHFERSHVVVKGETLTSIAGIFGVSVESIKAANHIVDERKLSVGQKLEIPDRTH